MENGIHRHPNNLSPPPSAYIVIPMTPGTPSTRLRHVNISSFSRALAEDSLMVSKYVVDIFKHLKQAEVGVLEHLICSIYLILVVPTPII